MKKLIIIILPLIFSHPLWAITCPDGEHAQCHSGSGRGGGYRTVCSCAADSCSFGYQVVPVGGVITSWTVGTVAYPDTCDSYTVQSTCVANQVLQPGPAVYQGCGVSYPEEYGDD